MTANYLWADYAHHQVLMALGERLEAAVQIPRPAEGLWCLDHWSYFMDPVTVSRDSGTGALWAFAGNPKRWLPVISDHATKGLVIAAIRHAAGDPRLTVLPGSTGGWGSSMADSQFDAWRSEEEALVELAELVAAAVAP